MVSAWSIERWQQKAAPAPDPTAAHDPAGKGPARDARLRPPLDLRRSAEFINWKLSLHDTLEDIAWVTGGLWWSDRYGHGTWSAFQDGRTACCLFFCPGCGALTSCGIEKFDNHPVWAWNGDKVKPTLQPSIVHAIEKGGCGWHGYLTGGQFKPC